jgi:hypothetical protein
MPLLRRVLVMLVACLVALPIAVADNTGTVSIVGKNVDTSDTGTFGLMLVLADSTWRVFEPGARSHFFKTKSGKYVSVAGTKTVFLCNTPDLTSCVKNKDSQAGNLSALTPSSAKQGDHGNGFAEETGIAFTWDVK